MKNLFHDAKSVMGWSTKLGDVEGIIAEADKLEKTGMTSSGNVAILSTKGSGKSHLLEWISKNYPTYRVVEGDVVTIAARALDQGLNPDLTLGECAKLSLKGGTLWDIYSKEAASSAYIKWMANFEKSLDYFTAFRGCDADFFIYVVADYKVYATQYKRRTDHMIEQATSQNQHAWRAHIQREHSVLPYNQYITEAKRKIKDTGALCFTFFNPGLDNTLYLEQFEPIDYLRKIWNAERIMREWKS